MVNIAREEVKTLIDDQFHELHLEASNDKGLATKFWNKYNPDPGSLLNNFEYQRLRDRLFSLLTAKFR
jgi:hypothetical protein